MADAKADVEALMDSAIPFAEQMLREHGEFLPFGAAMRTGGEIVSVAAHDGNDQPPSADLIELLRDGFRRSGKSGEFLATAIIYDVRVRSPSAAQVTDAIAAALDHKDNYSVIVFFPYTLNDGELEFGESFAQAGESHIFGE